MSAIFQDISNLVVDSLNIADETRKGLLTNALTANFSLSVAALKFDEQVGEGSATEVLGGGLISLAKLFAGKTPNLSDDDKDRIREAVNQIVELPDEDAEAAAETLFSGLLDSLDALQELVAAENEPPITA